MNLSPIINTVPRFSPNFNKGLKQKRIVFLSKRLSVSVISHYWLFLAPPGTMHCITHIWRIFFLVKKFRTIRTFKHCWWECKIIKPACKKIWQCLTKVNIHYDPAFTLRCSPKRNKILFSCRNLYIKVYSSFLNNWEKLEIIQMSLN